MKKPKRITDAFYMKKQLHGGYKIIEVFHFDNENYYRKKIIAKNVPYMDAESMIYNLEHKISKS